MQKSQVESNKKIYCLLLKRWLFTLNNIWSEGIYLNTQLIFIHFGCDYQVFFLTIIVLFSLFGWAVNCIKVAQACLQDAFWFEHATLIDKLLWDYFCDLPLEWNMALRYMCVAFI